MHVEEYIERGHETLPPLAPARVATRPDAASFAGHSLAEANVTDIELKIHIPVAWRGGLRSSMTHMGN